MKVTQLPYDQIKTLAHGVEGGEEIPFVFEAVALARRIVQSAPSMQGAAAGASPHTRELSPSAEHSMQEAAAGAGSTLKRKGSPSAPPRVKKQRDESSSWQALVEECLAAQGTGPDRIGRVARSSRSLQLQHKILPPHEMDEVLKLA
eukprot:SAG31_NODE_7625_length_1636_cov_1.796357_1_plen_146_part_10